MKRKHVSFRLSQDTIRDLEFLALKIKKTRKRSSRTDALRFLIHHAFSRMPDWRRKLIIDSNTY